MKNLATNAGVSLLEALLALSVIASIVLMVTKYYVLDLANSTFLATMTTIDKIITYEDMYCRGLNTQYLGVSVTILPSSDRQTIWGATIALIGLSSSSYQVKLPSTPGPVCQRITAALKSNPRINVTTTCDANNLVADMRFTVNVADRV